jgi:hypothetical protein
MPDKSLRAYCFCCASPALPISWRSGDRSPSGQLPMRDDRKSSGTSRASSRAQGRERLIKRWMDRSGSDRTEAMRLATEEWRRDNR